MQMDSLFSEKVMNAVDKCNRENPIIIQEKPKLQLRQYQKDAVESAINFFQSKKPPAICVAPTASGKSVIISEIINRIGNEKVLILQPNAEILKQNYNKLLQTGNTNYGKVGTYAASFDKNKSINQITYGIINSCYNKPEAFRGFKYIIIDECHNVSSSKRTENDKMYEGFLKAVNPQNVLGFTATPYRNYPNTIRIGNSKYARFASDGSKVRVMTNEGVFNDIIFNLDKSYLFDNGYLSKIAYYEDEEWNKNIAVLKQGSIGMDFTEKQMDAMFNHRFLERTARILENHSQRYNSMLVFVPSIKSASALKQAILNINDKASVDYVYGQHKNRDQIVSKFLNKDIKILINVNMLTTGFDFPDLDYIAGIRPTLSLSLYEQMVGRGARIGNKEKCTYFDFVGNIRRFGKIEDIRTAKDEKGKWQVYSKIGGQSVMLSGINVFR